MAIIFSLQIKKLKGKEFICFRPKPMAVIDRTKSQDQNQVTHLQFALPLSFPADDDAGDSLTGWDIISKPAMSPYNTLQQVSTISKQ